MLGQFSASFMVFMMRISPLARCLLEAHANHPQLSFYGTDVLGSMFREKDLERLDNAYEELERANLMERSNTIISFFGESKYLYRVTKTGKQEADKEKVS